MHISFRHLESSGMYNEEPDMRKAPQGVGGVDYMNF